MQSFYPESFERDMATTGAEWQSRWPLAMGSVPWAVVGDSTVHAHLPEGGQLTMQWTPLPDRVIALMRVPRLRVFFHFDQANQDARYRFMRHFDLVMQRGGG